MRLEEPHLLSVTVAVVTLSIATLLLYKKIFSDSEGRNKLAASEAPVFLTSRAKVKVPLTEKISLSHDVRLFRFGLPRKDMRLGLSVGKHVKVFAPNANGVNAGEWNGRQDPETSETIERKYTPTSSDDDLGHFDLVIKVYKPNDRFCDGGKMSQYLDSLSVGDQVEISGPFGLHEYTSRGNFVNMRKTHHYNKVGMIAGGTGITPMLQVITAVLKDPQDQTQLSLLYANQTEEDILVRDMLEDLQSKYPNQLRLHYTVDRPGEGWKYSSGFVNCDMIQQHLPAPAEDTVILMCGPPPMIKFACKQNLDKLGYSKQSQIEF